jgi:ketosteroid isomerase-like protein
MSEANVELVRRIYDLWEREESVAALVSEDLEYVNPSYAVEPGTRYGRKSLGIVRNTYEDFAIKVERIIDAGDELVVVLAYFSGSGSGSGVPVAGEHGYVWTVREGKAVRFQWFQSHREALDAAGMPAA